MTVIVKDIIGSIHKFDKCKVFENKTQIIIRYDDGSEIIFIKKNIISAQKLNDEIIISKRDDEVRYQNPFN